MQNIAPFTSIVLQSGLIKQKRRITLSSEGIRQIFEDESINDAKKIKYLQRLCIVVVQLEEYRLKTEIDIPLLESINQNIAECDTEPELALLNLVEVLAERGTHIPFFGEYNCFFIAFSQSSLLFKIEALLLQKMLSEQDTNINTQSSQVELQLVNIYFKIMKNKSMLEDKLNLCFEIISRYFAALNDELKIINKYELMNKYDLFKRFNSFISEKVDQLTKRIYHYTDEQQSDNNNNNNNVGKEKDNETESLMKNCIKILNSMKCIIRTNSDQIATKTIHENIVQLLHINCPIDINCEQRMNIPFKPLIEELQVAAINIIQELYEHVYDLRDIFETQNQLTDHLTAYIITYAKQLYEQIKKSKRKWMYLLLPSSSSSSLVTHTQTNNVVLASIYFLKQLLESNPNTIQIAASNTDLIPSLMHLTKFNRQYQYNMSMIVNEHLNEEQVEYERAISMRHNSIGCLQQIQSCQGMIQQQQLIQTEYICILIQAASNAGGIEGSNKVIKTDLVNILQYYQTLHQEYGYRSHPLLKGTQELHEDEGGDEEIDQHHFHMIEMRYDNVQANAHWARNVISNASKDRTNGYF